MNHVTREQCILHFQPVRKVQDNFRRLKGILNGTKNNVWRNSINVENRIFKVNKISVNS